MAATVTYEDVLRAAQDIEEAGERVTVERIRRRTGGSNSTIVPLLRRWRDGAKIDQTPEHGSSADPELPVPISRALAALGPAILSALAEVRAEERRSARAEIDMALAEVGAAKEVIDAEGKLAGELAAEADKLCAELEGVRSENTALRQEAAALRMELSAAQAERDLLAGQVNDLTGQLAQMAAAKATAEAQVDTWRAAAARSHRRRSKGQGGKTSDLSPSEVSPGR